MASRPVTLFVYLLRSARGRDFKGSSVGGEREKVGCERNGEKQEEEERRGGGGAEEGKRLT